MINRLVKYWILIFCLAPPLLVFSQIEDVKTEISSTSIKIGEQTELNIYIKYKPLNNSDSITWPLINDTITKQIELVESRKSPRKKMENEGPMMIESMTYIITSFDTGFHEIRPLPLILGKDTAYSKIQGLVTNFIKIDTTQPFKDIKEIYEITYNPFLAFLENNWLWITLGIVILAAIIFIIIYLVRRSKTEEEEEVIIARESANIIALRELEKLKKEKLWTIGEVKKHYVRLSNILRVYISSLYGFNALELTSNEIMTFINYKESKREVLTTLKEILSTSDMAKFAKQKPSEKENEYSIQEAINLIKQTEYILFPKEEKTEIKEA